MSVICRKFLLKLALRTYILLNLSHASTLSLWNEEIQARRVKREQRAQTATYRDTFLVQLFDTRNSSLANAKIYVLLYSSCFDLFWIWGHFPSISPQGLIFGGNYSLRRKLTYLLPKPSTEVLRKSTCYKALSLWNSLDNYMPAISSKSLFKNSLKRRTSCE